MDIDFIQSNEPDDMDYIEVRLGKIRHGIIKQIENGNYCYFRIIAGKTIARHETEDLEDLKRLVVETP